MKVSVRFLAVPAKLCQEAKRGTRHQAHTGMPELVLMPAPVTTTTLRALNSALAIPWRSSWESGWTCVVGIVGGGGRRRARSSPPRRALSRAIPHDAASLRVVAG